MEIDRPHHRSNSSNSCTSNTTSELFICFTSRLSSSSSSMKIGSKSILSPGRSREPTSQISLSNSLSRRLRSNGSLKGGQASPMFASNHSNGKKRGCSFENPEPSSPKVTCIGQVRVKTKKKQSKKMGASRSQRRGGEVSFRRVERSESVKDQNFEKGSHVNDEQEGLAHKNQRWVDLPLAMCEALRAFGAEFNCFLPCRSSCMASEKEKQEKVGSSTGSSCAKVFARWLMAVQDGGNEKGRDIELVVGEEEEEEEEEGFTERRRSYRRHVFEEIEFKDEKFGDGNERLREEEEGRVSICIPPKNALLLMRCRSDPVKMAALANKFWEAPVPDDGINEDDCDDKEDESSNVQIVHQEMDQKMVTCDEQDDDSRETRTEVNGGGIVEEEEASLVEHEASEVFVQETPVMEVHVQETEDPDELKIQENEVGVDENQEDQEHENGDDEDEDEDKDGSAYLADFVDQMSSVLESVNQETEQVNRESETVAKEELGIQERSEPEDPESVEEERVKTLERSEHEDPKTREEETGMESKEPLLPDCLLLMMCEPKLSMEVSKETWVCSTDFIRWLPEHSRPPQVNKRNGPDQPKRRLSTDRKNNSSNNVNSVQGNLQQPARSSCSYPAKPPARAAGVESMTMGIEKKLVGRKAFEPFALTRCKSEPMRSAAKLAPESCFWKNRKLEPHRPAALGVGAAGVGF